MIRAIIFDCFGVLAEDGWTPFKRKYVGDNQVLAQQIADLGKQNEYGMFDNETHDREAAKLIGVSIDEYRQAIGKRVPNEELFEFIKTELKPKYKIALMSNANYDVLNELFTKDQAAVFDASVMSFESRLIKPDRRMYELIVKRLGVELQDCVFIDDQERYCVAAEELGMASIFYKSLAQFKNELSKILSR